MATPKALTVVLKQLSQFGYQATAKMTREKQQLLAYLDPMLVRDLAKFFENHLLNGMPAISFNGHDGSITVTQGGSKLLVSRLQLFLKCCSEPQDMQEDFQRLLEAYLKQCGVPIMAVEELDVGFDLIQKKARAHVSFTPGIPVDGKTLPEEINVSIPTPAKPAFIPTKLVAALGQELNIQFRKQQKNK